MPVLTTEQVHEWEQIYRNPYLRYLLIAGSKPANP